MVRLKIRVSVVQIRLRAPFISMALLNELIVCWRVHSQGVGSSIIGCFYHMLLSLLRNSLDQRGTPCSSILVSSS
jgi:hypothetical protein